MSTGFRSHQQTWSCGRCHRWGRHPCVGPAASVGGAPAQSASPAPCSWQLAGANWEGRAGEMKKKKEDMIDCEYNLVSKSIAANLNIFT